MKIENLNRAVEISKEIRNVSEQIKNAQCILKNKKGFVISENTDLSGSTVGYIYENGNYPTSLYQNIIKCVISELQAHLEKLEKEIQSL